MTPACIADVVAILNERAPFDFDAWARVQAYLAEYEPEVLRSWHRTPFTPGTLLDDLRNFVRQWASPPPGSGLLGPFEYIEA